MLLPRFETVPSFHHRVLDVFKQVQGFNPVVDYAYPDVWQDYSASDGEV